LFQFSFPHVSFLIFSRLVVSCDPEFLQADGVTMRAEEERLLVPVLFALRLYRIASFLA
jgi:hypothetical protein